MGLPQTIDPRAMGIMVPPPTSDTNTGMQLEDIYSDYDLMDSDHGMDMNGDCESGNSSPDQGPAKKRKPKPQFKSKPKKEDSESDSDFDPFDNM